MTTPDYTAHNFVDGAAGGTPITAAILNDDEAAIRSLHTAVGFHVKDYGAKWDGVTDDSAAVASAASAASASGGTVVFSAGTGLAAGIIIYSNVTYSGAGRGATTIKAPNGANKNVFIGNNFATLTNTGSNDPAASPHGFMIQNLTIDGNRSQQTTAGSGIVVYGSDYDISNVSILNCWDTGMYTEFGPTIGAGGVAAHPEFGECRYRNIRIRNCGGWGWNHLGPSDCMAENIKISENNLRSVNAGGLWVQQDTNHLGGGLVCNAVHVWGYEHAWGMVLDSSIYATNCEVEGATTGQVLARSPLWWHGGRIFTGDNTAAYQIGLQLGDDGATPAAPNSRSVVSGGSDIRTLITGFWSSTRAAAVIAWVNANTSYVECQATLRAASASATIASGAVGTAITALTALSVNATSTFPNAGQIQIPTSTGTATLSYTGLTATSFTGVAVVSGTGNVAAGSATLVLNPVWGTIDAESHVLINGDAPSASRTQRVAWSSTQELGPAARDVGNAANGFVLRSQYSDVLNLNTSTANSPALQHIGGVDSWYTASYATKTIVIDGVKGHYATPATAAPTGSIDTSKAGTGATFSINGNDRRGVITITTGASGIGTFPASVVNITFAAAYDSNPFVIIAPVDGNSASVRPYGNAYANNIFLIGFAVAPAVSTSYYIAYFVEG